MVKIEYLGKILLTASIAAVLTVGADGAPKKKKSRRDINSVRTEQTATRKAIKETSRKLEANTKETRRRLAEYSTLSVEIEDKRKEITSLQERTNLLSAEIKKKQDSIADNNRKLQLLRDNYIKTLRRVQESPASLTTLTFVFASDSFNEAWRRMRYLNQFSQWRNVKAGEISEATDILDRQKASLASIHARHTEMLSQVNVARKELEVKQMKTDEVVKSLRKEEGALREVLRENEAKARRLDAELDRLIAEEQARQERLAKEAKAKAEREKAQREKARRRKATPKGDNSGKSNTTSPGRNLPDKDNTETMTNIASADRKLTGGFESNRGRLLFPVSGKYKIVRGFGVQKHPELSHVETNNSGIDIQVNPSTKARAIFEGTVSAIFVQPGYNTIVMLRHGSYISIYAGLTSVSVKKGDKVATGQNLGTISADVDNDNRAILHFEIRKEREKLNPLRWVR